LRICYHSHNQSIIDIFNFEKTKFSDPLENLEAHPKLHLL